MRPLRNMRIKKSEKDDLITRLDRYLGEGADHCKDEHDRCEENNIYLCGEQWAAGDIEKQAARDRPSFNMNKILPALNAVANREIMNRFVAKVYGRTDEDGIWADIANEFIRWAHDQSYTEHEESMGFRSNVSSGYACMHKYWDPLAAEEGAIVDEEIPIWCMLWDSRARKQNLDDRRWHICGKYVPKEEAERVYGTLSPGGKKFFKNLFQDDSENDLNQNRTVGSAGGRWPWDTVVGGSWFNRAEEEVFIIEAEWLAIKEQFKAAIPVNLQSFADLLAGDGQVFCQRDPQTGEIIDCYVQLPPELEQMLQQPPQQDPMQPPPDPMMMLQQMGIYPVTGQEYAQMDEEDQQTIKEHILRETNLETFETKKELDDFSDQYKDITGEEYEDFYQDPRRITRYAIRIQDEILDYGERPMGFTYLFMTGWPKSTRDKTTFFGFVDVTKGPQDWRNTFMSLVLTRLAYSPKQTMLIEEGALEDVDSFHDQIASPKGFATVPAGFIAGQRYVLMQPPNFPPMERELVDMADQGIPEMGGLSGVDTGAQGDLRRISGTVVNSVKEASNTILATLFDSLRRYRKTEGMLSIRFMREFYTPEQVSRIVGQKKSQGMPPMDEWPDIQRFDIKIDEAPTSTSERMEFFDFLTRTGTLDNWVQQGLIPPWKVFEWVPWMSDSDRRELVAYQQQQKQEQQAQQKLDSLMQQLQQVQDPQVQQILQSVQGGEQGGQEPPAQ